MSSFIKKKTIEIENFRPFIKFTLEGHGSLISQEVIFYTSQREIYLFDNSVGEWESHSLNLA